MKYFLILFILLTSNAVVHAADFSLVQTAGVETGKVAFDVMLDPQGESINALSGSISFPSENMELDAISTVGGVPVLWITSPQVSTERTFNSRKRIVFEGAIPGGFDGVRSPYYQGLRPGKIFTVSLKPVHEGNVLILVDTIDLRANDGSATRIDTSTNQLSLTIPDVSKLPHPADKKIVTEYDNPSLEAYLSRNPLVADNRWTLVIHDDPVVKTPLAYHVAETRISNPREVSTFEWREASNPYVLAYQSRNRFIHIKAEYADGSYSFKTIEPVENDESEVILWRILLGIVAVLGIVYALQRIKRKR